MDFAFNSYTSHKNIVPRFGVSRKRDDLVKWHGVERAQALMDYVGQEENLSKRSKDLVVLANSQIGPSEDPDFTKRGVFTLRGIRIARGKNPSLDSLVEEPVPGKLSKSSQIRESKSRVKNPTQYSVFRLDPQISASTTANTLGVNAQSPFRIPSESLANAIRGAFPQTPDAPLSIGDFEPGVGIPITSRVTHETVHIPLPALSLLQGCLAQKNVSQSLAKLLPGEKGPVRSHQKNILLARLATIGIDNLQQSTKDHLVWRE